MNNENWSISKNKYTVPEVTSEQILAEGNAAFKALREVLQQWRVKGKIISVALGGESGSGGWSMVYENGLWSVFVAERGIRYTPCFFVSAWDAVNFIGFDLASGSDVSEVFTQLKPPSP